MPDDATSQWGLGNTHAGYTAFVPKGSIARGKELVAAGGGLVPCRTCHGDDLKGSAIAPPLAGRAASYIVRQLYDMQHRTRRGQVVAPMLPEVATLTVLFSLQVPSQTHSGFPVDIVAGPSPQAPAVGKQ